MLDVVIIVVVVLVKLGHTHRSGPPLLRLPPFLAFNTKNGGHGNSPFCLYEHFNRCSRYIFGAFKKKKPRKIKKRQPSHACDIVQNRGDQEVTLSEVACDAGVVS